MDAPEHVNKITINGQTYARLEDVPPEYRDLIEKQLEALRQGKPEPGVHIKKHFKLAFSTKRGPDSDDATVVAIPWRLALVVGALAAAAAYLLGRL